MGFFIKVFAIFWAIWIIWYLTGGPLRDEATSLFVNYDANGNIISASSTNKTSK